MLAKRIIPCLIVKDGRTVKGVNFTNNLVETGDPIELGRRYSEAGADELVFLDMNASHEGRDTFIDIVRSVAKNLSIPFTVGGGVRSVSDVARLLSAGADKVSINSAAIRRPELISEISKEFGAQVCVVGIDAKQDADGWRCYMNGGRLATDKYLFSWARRAEELGAGEIMFTSMDHDVMKSGFACETIKMLSETVTIPIIASGGGSAPDYFRDVLRYADGALASSVFHFREINIPDLKKYLRQNGIIVR